MRFLICLLLSLSLVGCAAMDTVGESFSGISDYFSGGADNAEPPSPLVEYTPELKLEEIWQASVGVGSDEQTLKLIPAVANGKIVAADREGLVQARDTTTGKLLWEVETEANFSGGPGIGNSTVILGSSNAEVFALSLENGTQLWKAAVTSEVLSIPVIGHGVVVVRTTDGSITALNEKTGAKLWSYEVAVPALSIRGTGAPVIVDDNLIGGNDNGKLIALRLADGKFVWEASVAIPQGRSEVERLVDLDVDLIESAGVIYVSSFHGGASAASVLDGEVLWRNDTINSYTGLTSDWRYLYVSDSQGYVYQLDKRSGSSLWKQSELHNRRVTAPAVYENYVVVADLEGYVHWLGNSDGRQMARIQAADAPIDAKPLVVGDTVFIYANDGTLTALKARLP
ncbi:outer membrane protein assembly factor BamB [Methylosoma difficile]